MEAGDEDLRSLNHIYSNSIHSANIDNLLVQLINMLIERDDARVNWQLEASGNWELGMAWEDLQLALAAEERRVATRALYAQYDGKQAISSYSVSWVW